MEIDRELIVDCIRDMKYAHKYLVELGELGAPIFIPAMALSLRIIELEEAVDEFSPPTT